LSDAQVSEEEEKKLMKLLGLFQLWQHHPLYRRLPQEEEVRLFQQEQLIQQE
jgi:hypothetical protein